ncbi:MAG: nicotinamide-nucleotide amidohydrolase family protein [Acutalibacteraceae bacterium]|nr:nicotinamide-nucleotide amidohydrolase family protein [Acutalibacteraceae bacterium]
MNAEILSFSYEKVNSNINECEAYISTLSQQLRIENTYHTEIRFEKDKFVSALKSAISRNNVIFVCGEVSIISEAICLLMHCKGQPDAQYDAFASCKEASEQLLFPDGSVVFFDRNTKEAAFALKIAGKTVIALPSLLTALENLTDEFIIPYFSKEFHRSLSRVQINIFGIDAYNLSTVLDSMRRLYQTNISVSFHNGIVSATVSACTKSFSESDNACFKTITELKKAFGYNIFEMGNKTLSCVAVEAMRKNGLTVATAESCTGGFLSETITSVSCASEILELGICAYSNRIKRDAVGVSEEILTTYGAISKETAMALANGIRRLSGASLGVGITGVAGPSSSEGKPVGTVYVAVCDERHFWIRSLNMSPDSTRDEIRNFAVNTALDLIRRYCICLPDTLSGFCTIDKPSLLFSQPEIEYVQPKDDTDKTDTDKKDAPLPTSFYEQEVSFYTEEEQKSIDDTLAVESENDIDGYLLEDKSDEEYESFRKKPSKNIFIKLFSQISGFYKNGTKTQSITKICFTVFIAVLLAFCIFVGIYFGSAFRDRSQLKNTQKAYISNPTTTFESLETENSDFTGWLTIENTQINNPVYQSLDNSYYTNHNMKKQKSRYGALYFDYRNEIGVSQNLVIYGLNLNDGAMFGGLSQYLDEGFIKKNQNVSLTLNNTKTTYKIFAVLIMNSQQKDDNNHLFEFTKTTFNENNFDSWYNELTERNLYLTDAKLTHTDNLLTLVTTSKAFDGARLVIVAKQVAESSENHIFSVNPSPRYPQIWYDSRNLEAVWSSPEADESSQSQEASTQTSSEEEPTETPSTPQTPSRPANSSNNSSNSSTTESEESSSSSSSENESSSSNESNEESSNSSENSEVESNEQSSENSSENNQQQENESQE